MTKKIVFSITLCFFSLVILNADNFRMGIIGTFEINDNPFDTDSYDGMERFFPGLYCEVLFDHVGFGTTMLARFTSAPSAYPGVEKAWAVTWLGSFELRYHFFTEGFLDPFAEVGIGCAGLVDLPQYDSSGDVYDGGGLDSISLFGTVGGGVVLRLDAIHVGVKVLYRFINDAIPATPFAVTPVAPFESSLFVGWSF